MKPHHVIALLVATGFVACTNNDSPPKTPTNTDMSSDMFVDMRVDMAVDMNRDAPRDIAPDMPIDQPTDLAPDVPNDMVVDLAMDMPQDMSPGPSLQINSDWQSIDLGEQNADFTLSFEVIPDSSPLNTVIGVAPQIARQYNDMANIVRLNTMGNVDGRSGDDYIALEPPLAYQANDVLKVLMRVNIAQKRYTLTVESPTQTTHTKADLSFRTSQQSANTLRYLSLYSTQGTAQIRGVRLNNQPVKMDVVMPPQPMGLLNADIDNVPLKNFGQLTRADLEQSFGPIANSYKLEHLSIIEDNNGRVIRAKYDPKSNGSDRVGFRVMVPPGDERWLSYQLYFEPGFEFVKGGKLPGLAGGAANTGGNKPNGTDGYTSRLMWRRNNALVVYLYHPDQPSTYGEDFRHQGLTLQTGRWYTVRQRIVMNTNNQANGRLESWVDGQPYIAEDIRYRSRDNAFSVDSLMFSTFYGGNDSSWAPSKTTYIRFDNFKIAATRAGVD